MTSFLAAAIQLTSTADPDANFAAAEEQIDLAARRGADLVGLPENFAFMGEDAHRLEMAPLLADRAQQFLITMARRYQVTLLGGEFYIHCAPTRSRRYAGPPSRRVRSLIDE